MKRWPNVGLLLGQRRRRLANSDPTLAQCLMFAGLASSVTTMEVKAIEFHRIGTILYIYI